MGCPGRGASPRAVPSPVSDGLDGFRKSLFELQGCRVGLSPLQRRMLLESPGMMEGRTAASVAERGWLGVCWTVGVPGVLGQYRVIVLCRAPSRFIVFFLQSPACLLNRTVRTIFFLTKGDTEMQPSTALLLSLELIYLSSALLFVCSTS